MTFYFEIFKAQISKYLAYLVTVDQVLDAAIVQQFCTIVWSLIYIVVREGGVGQITLIHSEYTLRQVT